MALNCYCYNDQLTDNLVERFRNEVEHLLVSLNYEAQRGKLTAAVTDETVGQHIGENLL